MRIAMFMYYFQRIPKNYKTILRDFNLNKIFITDRLKEKLKEAFPQAKYQVCWVHIIRNVLLK